MKDKGLNIIIIILVLFIIWLSIYVLFFNKETEITVIRLDRNNISLYVGDEVKINTILENVNLDDILWKSDNEEVAGVSDGKVSAKNEGTATITIYTKDGNLSDDCIVEVSKRVVERIILDKNNMEILVGETGKINATIIPEELKNEELKWLSNNEKVAKVDGNGIVTGIDNGEAVISVISGAITSECIVKVSKKELVQEPKEEEKPKEEKPKEEVVVPPKKEEKPKEEKLGKLEIHFINAGGYYDDAIFIKSDKAAIFIDGGRGKDAVVKYLHDLNVQKIDYVIGSHTEYDHIDAQAEVIKQFNVSHALYPNNITRCGCSCESIDVGNVNLALRNKNMTPEVQPIPSKLTIGNMTLYFIAPLSIGCNKNNNSFIFILQFGNNKFMFTGDADSNFNKSDELIAHAKSLGLSGIEADVFKYPHHGNQSLSDKLFDTMKTKYIVVPNVNASQHPTQYFRDKINAKGIKMYRQSDSKTGNILITSDGNNINFTMDVEASKYKK